MYAGYDTVAILIVQTCFAEITIRRYFLNSAHKIIERFARLWTLE